MNQYPKVEFYSEVDKGDPRAGSNTWTDPLGNKVYGGAADYRPFIMRKTYWLNDVQAKQLRELSLRFMPYFKEQKESITLAQYFDARQQKDAGTFRSLLPISLDGLYSQKDNEYFSYWDTGVLYETTHPRAITVVWMDASTWYVDDVYYACDGLGDLLHQVKPEEDYPWEGSFTEFLRLSPIFQQKISEGYPELAVPTKRPALPLKGLVLGYSLSPGLPNTTSYHFELSADGVLEYTVNGAAGKAQIDPARITTLFMKAKRVDWRRYTLPGALPVLTPTPAFDRQTKSISVWYEGKVYQIDEHEFPVGDSFFNDFCVFVVEFFEPELQLAQGGRRGFRAPEK